MHTLTAILLSTALAQTPMIAQWVPAAASEHPVLAYSSASSTGYVVLESNSYTQYADLTYANTTVYIKGKVVLEELELRNANLVGLDDDAILVLTDGFDNEGNVTVSNLTIQCSADAAADLRMVRSAKAVTLNVWGSTTALGQPATATVQVNFDANGGQISSGHTFHQASIGVDGKAAVSLPTPVKSGDTFKGWSTSPDGTGTLITGAVYTTDKNTTLYAVYGKTSAGTTNNGSQNGSSGSTNNQTSTQKPTTNNQAQIQTLSGGTWTTNASGKSMYRLADGSYAKNTLATIGNNTYYFNANSVMAQNTFAVVNGKTYFFDNAGHMKTGWLKAPGTDDWYCFGADGAMKTGWVQDGKNWYYLESDGEMAESEFIDVDGKTYYVDNSGAMKTGWLKKENKWYLLQKDGSMAVSTTIDGYIFNEKGVCLNP